MTDVQTKIERYYDLKPATFNVLKSLTLSQEFDYTGVMAQQLSVVLSRNSHEEGENLSLSFFGVRKLEIRQPSFSHITVWLEILAGHELKTVESAFLVRDPEQERVIFFECADFAAAITSTKT